MADGVYRSSAAQRLGRVVRGSSAAVKFGGGRADRKRIWMNDVEVRGKNRIWICTLAKVLILWRMKVPAKLSRASASPTVF